MTELEINGCLVEIAPSELFGRRAISRAIRFEAIAEGCDILWLRRFSQDDKVTHAFILPRGELDRLLEKRGK